MSILDQPIQDVIFRSGRKIGDIAVQVVVNENSSDVLTITKQPVQQGASIADHAYKEPGSFSCSILFRDNLSKSLSKIYQDLLDLQISRVPFTIVTPKRVYKSMLIATLGQTTDKSTENCLAISASFQEVIIVSVTTTQVPRRKQKNAAATGKTENAGKKSALATVVDGFKAALP